MMDASETLKQAQQCLSEDKIDETVVLTTQLIDMWEREKQKPAELLRAYRLRCAAYLSNDETADLLSDAERLIRLAPDDVLGYAYRGLGLLHLNELEAARAEFYALLDWSLTPTYRSSVYHALGLIAYAEGDDEWALAYYWESLRQDITPRMRASVIVNRAAIHFEAGHWDEALYDYALAESLYQEEYDHARVGLAVIHAAQGEWDKALAIWRSLMGDESDFTNADKIIREYFRWTPSMADLARQIIARLPATHA